MKFALLLFLTATIVVLSSAKIHPLSADFIAAINNHKTTWTAGRNFPENIPLSEIKKLLGVIRKQPETQLPPRKNHPDVEALPESFDAREKWPECADIISEIRDQGACGSSWAFGAVEAISDRICVQTNNTVKVTISAEDLMDCCTNCGDGCNGGDPFMAWLHYTMVGIVTGGGYGTKEGCKAYTIPSCDHHVDGFANPCGDNQPTPACQTVCDDGVGIDYNEDLRSGAIYLLSTDPATIQQDILKYGPVEASFEVYTDFFQYKSGVYQHVEGELEGVHSVKILGWGVEDGTPYWLAANSWNENWGDKGFFKILRGEGECDIEGNVLGGYPHEKTQRKD